jgi:general secretion pathway protein G
MGAKFLQINFQFRGFGRYYLCIIYTLIRGIRVKNSTALRANQFSSLNNNKGFTLIEVMVVIAILGILATMVIPRIMGRPDEARILAAKQDVSTIVQALKLYRLDNGRYPTTEQGLRALAAPPTVEPLAPNWKTGGYLERLPNDPWGSPYQYANPGTKSEIDVFSFGADSKLGGTGLDADISN